MIARAIWWVRRDLRLSDNQALNAAISGAEQVIPVFIDDPFFKDSPMVGARRTAFLWAGLRKLDADLRARDSYLELRSGSPLKTLTDLVKEMGAERIFAETDYSPYARRRDKVIGESLDLQLVGGPSLSHPNAVLKGDGSPYTVFTPYMRAWKEIHLVGRIYLRSKPSEINTPNKLGRDSFSDDFLPQDVAGFEAGEKEAQRRLSAFTAGESPAIFRYAEERNRMDLEGTSQLSPYLRLGMLSSRQAIKAAQDAGQRAPDKPARQGAEVWLNELIWREFYLSILYHFPHVLRRSFRQNLRDIRWNNNRREFEAWCQGLTGYPVVDAAMRQLAQTGWMHNRARMIVASFLVKDLLIDWRWGERWFMQQLIDGDPAANNGGWQWTAGTGTDAAPYFRIFNPILQSKKFDPQGRYIRRWLPELAQVPARYIHTPWEMPDDVGRKSGCMVGVDYPAPIIDHRFARQRTLAAYKNAG
jgi:deoxyribodipyrimidine photo-lyase